MASILAKAAKGNRAAMTRLYEQTKKDTYFIAQQLLRDEDKAQAAVIIAFEDTLRLSTLEALTTEAAFAQAVIDATVYRAKLQLTRRNPKALRIPADRRFDIRTVSADRPDNDSEAVFATFTELQRLIFVLHTATDMTEEQLAVASKLDRRTLAEAMGAEHRNLEKILGSSPDAFIEAFKASQAAVKVPTELDDAVEAVIGEIVAPVEKAKRKRTLIRVLVTLGICALLAGFSALLIWDMTHTSFTASDTDGTTESTDDTTTTTNAAQASVGTVTSVTATHYADIDIKDYGTITVALDSTSAPETVFNFMTLAESGFYDGLTFHRIMEGFMMQGGDPNGDGTGGSDKNVTGEFAANGIENPLSHVRGAISMARSTDYDSGSSQFFIVHEDSTFLDGNYAAFGYVTEGMDIVDAICAAAGPDDGTIPTDQQPIINSITVRSAY